MKNNRRIIHLLIVFALSFPLSMQPVHAREPTQSPSKTSFNPELSGVPVYGYRIEPSAYLIDIGSQESYDRVNRDMLAGKVHIADV